jgi:hypothetical protein
MSENKVLRRVFGPNKEGVTKDVKIRLNNEFYNFHSSPNIISMIKSRRMRWNCSTKRELIYAWRIILG